ncbi:MAG: GDP-L-fucose synthase [Chloroflexota bacterium]
MEKNSKIFVAGHRGLAGSALVRLLQSRGLTNLLLRSSSELDLTDQAAVRSFFRSEKPSHVFMAAGKGGGISANTAYPAEFIYTNSQIQNNIVHSAWESGVKKLLFIACSCIYPRDCPQPMGEESLLSSPVEPTSEPFAVAKIAGLKMCQAHNRQYGTNFISVVPATLYGPNDNFDPETSHFLAAMIVKFHRAKAENAPRVLLWGTGTPERELLYVDDFADAAMFLMREYSGTEHLNISSGQGVTIREAAGMVKEAVGFDGEVVFDETKPDGAPRKVLDASRIRALGWAPRTPLREGLRKAYDWYVKSSLSAMA